MYYLRGRFFTVFKMVIWSGAGFLVAVVIFGFGLATETVTEYFMQDDQYFQEHGYFSAFALLYPAIVLYVLGKWLNKEEPGRHSFFYIPVEYWACILLIMTIWKIILEATS